MVVGLQGKRLRIIVCAGSFLVLREDVFLACLSRLVVEIRW